MKHLLFASILFAHSLYAKETPVFGIVDPYSSGEDLAYYLQELGYPTLHIDSNTVYCSKLESEEDKHDICPIRIPHMEDFDRVLTLLKSLHVDYVLPGCEDGVLYADKLCFSLHLPFNGIEKSAARRNKFLMHQEVAKAGIRIPEQALFSSKESALAWELLQYPCVVKPVNSCASDGVFICENEEEFSEALDRIFSHITVFNEVVRECLVQEYIDGEEYVVNGISCNGESYITDIWKYVKNMHNNSKVVYERIQLIPSEDEHTDLLKQYAKKVLAALDYKIGAFHMEVKLNKKGEPVLIEVGARLSGALLHRLVRQASIHQKSQLEYLVDAYLEPENLEEIREQNLLSKRAFCVQLISTIEGEVKKIDHLEAIRLLPSFFHINLHVEEGQQIYPTVDYATSPGLVLLLHEDVDQLERDYARLRELEKEMFVVG